MRNNFHTFCIVSACVFWIAAAMLTLSGCLTPSVEDSPRAGIAKVIARGMAAEGLQEYCKTHQIECAEIHDSYCPALLGQ